MARALENTCVTVLSPTVGDAPWSPAVDRNAGAAGVYVPADHGFSETGVLAEGALNQPQWVYAEVDLARLQRVKQTGEMRNSTDWAAQPGAAPLAANVEVSAARLNRWSSRNFAKRQYPGPSGNRFSTAWVPALGLRPRPG